MGDVITKETEAKFLVWRPELIDSVLRKLGEEGYALTERGTATHLDRYFDTRDWSLLRAGWACRSRTRNGDSRLMLKSMGEQTGSVFHREEIEQPRAGEVLADLAKGKECSELFTVESERTVYDVSVPGNDDCKLEIDLDRSRIEAEKHYHKALGRIEFMELEFEGDADEVERLAEVLSDESALVPSQMSKFERGIQAAGYTVPVGREFGHLPKPTMQSPIRDLVYWYLGQQFDALRLQRPRAWEGLDPEGIHKMRVATRRLRASLRAFRQLLPDYAFSQLEPEVKWLASVLGNARDADVCEMSAEQYKTVLEDLPESALEPYVDRMKQTTLDAHAALVEELAGPRYSELIGSLKAFINVGIEEDHSDDERVEDCDDRIVGKELSKTLKRAKKVSKKSTPRKLHKLRIEAKRLRYLLEVFCEVNADKWTPMIEALEEFQEVIGLHQDSVTAIERLTDYLEETGEGVEAQAIEQLIAFEEHRMIDRRTAAWQEWRKFRKTL